MHKQIKKEPTAPLIAVRRRERRQRGQQAGTVATSPKEVDSIIREVYDEIYKGDGKKGEDPEELANK